MGSGTTHHHFWLYPERLTLLRFLDTGEIAEIPCDYFADPHHWDVLYDECECTPPDEWSDEVVECKMHIRVAKPFTYAGLCAAIEEAISVVRGEQS